MVADLGRPCGRAATPAAGPRCDGTLHAIPGASASVDQPPLRAVDFANAQIGSRDWLLGSLRELEADIHRGGWDKEPQLWAIVEHSREVGGPRLEALAATESWMWHLPGMNYQQCLLHHGRFLAGWTGAPIHAGIMRELAEDRLAAVALVIETWEAVGTEEQVRAYRSNADNPDGWEARIGIAVGTDGTVYQVNRKRGRDPIGSWFHPPTLEEARFGDKHPTGRQCVIGGLTVNMIRAMVNAVNAAAGLPPVPYQFASTPERLRLEQVKGGPL